MDDYAQERGEGEGEGEDEVHIDSTAKFEWSDCTSPKAMGKINDIHFNGEHFGADIAFEATGAVFENVEGGAWQLQSCN